MKSLPVVCTLIVTFTLQSTAAIAQVQLLQEFQSKKPRFNYNLSNQPQTPKNISEFAPHFNPVRDNELRECMLSIAFSPPATVSAFDHIERTTRFLLKDDLISREQLKKIYQKNGCNTEGVDESYPERPVNSILGFSVDSLTNNENSLEDASENFPSGWVFPERNMTKQEREDELLANCHKQKLLEDVEGCQSLRKLSDSIQNGQFTSADLNSIQNHDFRNARVGRALEILAAATVIYEFVERRFFKDSDSSKKPDKSKETSHSPEHPSPASGSDQPSQRPEPASEPTEHPHESPVVEPIPEVEPISSQDQDDKDVDPLQNEASFEKFTSQVEKEVNQCDQKKNAKKAGKPFSVLRNQNIIETNSVYLDETKNKQCDPKQLEKDLAAEKQRIFSPNRPHGSELSFDVFQRKQNERRQKLLDSYQECAILKSSNYNGSDKTKRECEEIFQAIVGRRDKTNNSLGIPEFKKLDSFPETEKQKFINNLYAPKKDIKNPKPIGN